MDIETITDIVGWQLRGVSDHDGEEIKVYTLDNLGEVFLKTDDGQFFKLTVETIEADAVSFIDEDDWA